MLMEFLADLEGSALAADLRSSKWIYPLVNAGHIAGIALLFGGIAAFDLRLMGAWHRVPLHALARVLVPVAGAGLIIAAVCGALLFIVKATQYATSPLFQAKMIMLIVGLTNVLAYHFTSHRLGWMSAGAVLERPVPLQRLLGAVSLSVWLSVLVLGRLVGYFQSEPRRAVRLLMALGRSVDRQQGCPPLAGKSTKATSQSATAMSSVEA